MKGINKRNDFLGENLYNYRFQLQSKTAKRRNKRKGRNNGPQQSEVEWASLTPKSLWQQIKADLKSYYDWETPCPESLDATIEHFHLQKISLLRNFCIKTGIQILLREYNFENKNRATFFEEDILSIFPVVKHINPRVSKNTVLKFSCLIIYFLFI